MRWSVLLASMWWVMGCGRILFDELAQDGALSIDASHDGEVVSNSDAAGLDAEPDDGHIPADSDPMSDSQAVDASIDGAHEDADCGGGTACECAGPCIVKPSNVGTEPFATGTADLDAGATAARTVLRVNTDTGEILADNDPSIEPPVVVRAAGTGVIAGIGFTTLDGSGRLGVFSTNSLTVPAEIRMEGFGSRAWVWISRRDMEIEGEIFAAATADGPGPGGGAGASGDEPASGTGAGANGASSDPDGGGGGGSFGGRGGMGGGPRAARGGAGGTPHGNASLIPLIGGSGGGRGGTPEGNGGHGGGALQLTSSTRIVINGIVNACGGGGKGGVFVAAENDGGGGGGGGSGGAILLEAPSIEGAGSIAANGGAGGQGARSTSRNGLPGNDGSPTAAPVPGQPSAELGGGSGAGSDGNGTASNGQGDF